MGKLLRDRKITSILLIYLLLLPSYGQTGNSWDKVRYNGGTLSTEVSLEDWGNHLSVTSEEVRLLLKDGKTISIKPSSITGLRYGQEAHRRVGLVSFTRQSSTTLPSNTTWMEVRKLGCCYRATKTTIGPYYWL